MEGFFARRASSTCADPVGWRRRCFQLGKVPLRTPIRCANSSWGNPVVVRSAATFTGGTLTRGYPPPLLAEPTLVTLTAGIPEEAPFGGNPRGAGIGLFGAHAVCRQRLLSAGVCPRCDGHRRAGQSQLRRDDGVPGSRHARVAAGSRWCDRGACSMGADHPRARNVSLDKHCRPRCRAALSP